MPNTFSQRFSNFLKQDYASGILLFLMTVAAMVAVNSPLSGLYNALLSTFVEVRIGEFEINKPLLPWVNDGLMAIFFFHVGLEIKREIVAGRLGDRHTAVLPICGALGGIIIPALLYYLINMQDPESLRGWAISTTTDIAFTLGVLALLGNRVPSGLKLFLLSLAVIDDLCAIIIIAFFYTSELGVASLIIAIFMIVLLFLLNRLRITSRTPYILVGIMLWATVLKSGIHATLAGVVLALFIPYIDRPESNMNMLKEIETDLKGTVYLVILPIFAFVNSGIYLGGLSLNSLFRPVPLGIITGLFLGKQCGIFAFTWLAVKTGMGKLPEDANWKQLYGVSLLCGIGFTMSLFISSLAFQGGNMAFMIDDRLGIILGSLLSGLAGYFVLRSTTSRQP